MLTRSSRFDESASAEYSTSRPHAQAVVVREPQPDTLINLRIVQGPLNSQESEAILSQYNRLASANIPMQDYLRWVQESPEGPACHALLETREGEIVGHTSLIPLRGVHGGTRMLGAKSEYSFIREEFRASKIQGFEQSGQLKNLIYIHQLFQHCRSRGWSPLLISTSSAFHRVFGSIGCYPVDFPLWECLLVLRPGAAAWKTPNLRRWQRASLWCAGLVQKTIWGWPSFFSRYARGICTVPVDESSFIQSDQSLSFFQDQESLRWRYPEAQYERLVSRAKGQEDLIVKKGSTDGYLRVCQWRLSSGPPSHSLIARLVHRAHQQQALGVRWAVYGNDAVTASLVRRLQRLGFLCARRVRTLLVNTADRQFLDHETWNVTDAMFSFDH